SDRVHLAKSSSASERKKNYYKGWSDQQILNLGSSHVSHRN
ncbi:hypothetical protein LINPERHAP1_LOCUS24944, partial [Linum perenne]